MSKLCCALALASAAGCTSSWALESRAMHDEEHARVRAEQGDGADAARLMQRANDLRAAARLHDNTHGRLWSEVTLN